jgi:hypothetical protein
MLRSVESGHGGVVSLDQLQEMVENMHLPENQVGPTYRPEDDGVEIRVTADAAAWFQEYQMSQEDHRGQKRQMSRQTIDESYTPSQIVKTNVLRNTRSSEEEPYMPSQIVKTNVLRHTMSSEEEAATPNQPVMRQRSTENRKTPPRELEAATPNQPVMRQRSNKNEFNANDFNDIMKQIDIDHARIMLQEEKTRNEAILRAMREQVEKDEAEYIAVVHADPLNDVREEEENVLVTNAGTTVPNLGVVVQSPPRPMRQIAIDSEEDRPLAQVYGNPRRVQNIAVETLQPNDAPLDNADLPLDLGDDFAPLEVPLAPAPAKRAVYRKKKKRVLEQVVGPVSLRKRIWMIRNGTPILSNFTMDIANEWEQFCEAEETILPQERKYKAHVGKITNREAQDALKPLRRTMKALYMGLRAEYQSPDFDETNSDEAVEEEKLEHLYNEIKNFLKYYYASQRVVERASGKVRQRTVKVKPIEPGLNENEPFDLELNENEPEEL